MKQIVFSVVALALIIGMAAGFSAKDRGQEQAQVHLTKDRAATSCHEASRTYRAVDLMALLTPHNQEIPLTGNAARLIPAGWMTEIIMQKVPQAAACFAPGTDPEIVDWYNQTLYGLASDLAYFTSTRWGGAQGTPRHLTWSFVPDGLSISSGVGEPVANSDLFARMDVLFGGNRALWIAQFQSCFDRWSELTGLTYTRVTNGVNDWDDGGAWGNIGGPTRGDVRISMKNIDGGSGVLAYNFFPSGGGDMVIDRSENWGASGNSFRFLRNTLMHEHGHGIGLQHVCTTNNTKLMEPFLNTNFDGPRHDDIRGGQRHYGDPYEPNDDAASATDLGALALGGTVTLGTLPGPAIPNTALLSIDGDSKQDFFQVTTSEESTITATVTPRGFSYDSSPQVSGSCTSGNFIDSSATVDLSMQILNTDGVAILATGAANPAGLSETASAIAVPAGTYFVRVFENGSPLQSQLYDISITAQSPTPFPPTVEAGGMLKNRYISFQPNNPGEVVAFRIDKVTSPTGSCYAGPPDSQGNSQCLPLPTFRIWNEPVVSVGDCAIVPVSNYHVRATFDDVAFASPLALQTINQPSINSKLWGDVSGSFDGAGWTQPDQLTNVNDILAVLARITGSVTAPSFSRVNVQAVSAVDPCLNAFVNTADLFIIVKAVAGDAYPFTTDPMLCPFCPPLP